MVLLACLLALLMFVPAVPAFAEGLNDGRVLFGEDFTLESGEELDGDLAALIAITICLLPISFFVAVATLAAVLFGWTAWACWWVRGCWQPSRSRRRTSW